MKNKERINEAWGIYKHSRKGIREADFKLGYEAVLIKIQDMHINRCHCANCVDLLIMENELHTSDCAVHNMPAEPNGECDCKDRRLPSPKESE